MEIIIGLVVGFFVLRAIYREIAFRLTRSVNPHLTREGYRLLKK
jgi:hypothetical protein